MSTKVNYAAVVAYIADRRLKQSVKRRMCLLVFLVTGRGAESSEARGVSPEGAGCEKVPRRSGTRFARGPVAARATGGGV